MTYLIAEIGINHDGSIDVARALIDAASRAKVDAVKFQYRNIKSGISIGAREIGDEILDAEIKRSFLTSNELIELAKYASCLNLEVGISFFDVVDVDDFGESLKIFDFFKVPSVEFLNLALAERLQSFGKRVLFSTGGCVEDDIERFASRNTSTGQNVLLHCVSNYPVALHNSNLGYIDWLKEKYHFQVGYSSHDSDYLVCLAAIGHGISILERHITLDKVTSGLDHSSSSTEEEFYVLSKFCRNAPVLNSGCGPRRINQGELLNKQNLGRSYYAKKSLSAGDPITSNDFQYRSPRVGLNYVEFQESLGKKLERPIGVGECLGRSHFKPLKTIGWREIEFCLSCNIGLPVRLHDIHEITKIFPLSNFELHLSFGEAKNKIRSFIVPSALKYSIHLPDYLRPNRLLDPFSKEAAVREESILMINEIIDFARCIEDQTGHQVPIVASFSGIGMTPQQFYPMVIELTRSVKEDRGIDLLPQWLPPIAWYFGGSISIDVFNNSNAARIINDNDLPFCLDLSHYFLCINSGTIKSHERFDELLRIAGHFHIAGAQGLDGEGSGFSGMNAAESAVMEKVIRSDKRKIIEVWQGHLEEYRGFKDSILELYGLWG